MSELVQLRHRIKAIETIKKVTHAMRLISMAMHNRFRAKQKNIQRYQETIQKLFESFAIRQNEIKSESLAIEGKILAILIGSQKGLCGNFTTNVLSFFTNEIGQTKSTSIDLIPVGKKTLDTIDQLNYNIIMQFSNLSNAIIPTIAQSINEFIMKTMGQYNGIYIYYNYPKTFFSQKSTKINLMPILKKTSILDPDDQNYRWENDIGEIKRAMIKILIEGAVQNALFSSLIAEQSARFNSMDSSTRNATQLLDTMKLDYNKKRQANITKELTDLISGL